MKVSFASKPAKSRAPTANEVAQAPRTFSPFDKAFDDYVTRLYRERPIYLYDDESEPRPRP